MSIVSPTVNAFEALVAALLDPDAMPHTHGPPARISRAKAEGVPPHGYPRPARRKKRKRDDDGGAPARSTRRSKGGARPKRGGQPKRGRAKDAAD